MVGTHIQGKGSPFWWQVPTQAWGPEAKCVCVLPQTLTTCPRSSLEPLGADAFLPALTEELIWSPHIGETQLDVEFLMELLDPEELRGEGELSPSGCPDTEKGAPSASPSFLCLRRGDRQ